MTTSNVILTKRICDPAAPPHYRADLGPKYCLICLNKIKPRQSYVDHEASADRVHRFHIKCIRSWAMGENGGICPACTRPWVNRIEYLPQRGRDLTTDSRREELERVGALRSVEGIALVGRSGRLDIMSVVRLISSAYRDGDLDFVSRLREVDKTFAISLLPVDQMEFFFRPEVQRPAPIQAFAAILCAIEAGQPETLRIYERHKIDLQPEGAYYVLAQAVKAGNPEVLRAVFLLIPPMSIGEKQRFQQWLGQSVEEAVKASHLEIVRVLLEAERTLTGRDLLSAVWEAAMIGSGDIIRVLLEDGRTLPQLTDVIICAAAHDDWLAVETLLSVEGLITDASCRLPVIQEAIGGNHPSIIPTILTLGELLPEEDHFSLLQRAICSRLPDGTTKHCLEAIPLLLTHAGPLSEERFLDILEYAISTYPPALPYLLSDGRAPSQKNLDRLIQYAKSIHCLEAIGYLLEEGRTMSSLGGVAKTIAEIFYKGSWDLGIQIAKTHTWDAGLAAGGAGVALALGIGSLNLACSMISNSCSSLSITLNSVALSGGIAAAVTWLHLHDNG